MGNDPFEQGSGEAADLAEREERCQKALKAVSKAIVMRVFICGLLLWIIFRSGMALWTAAMLLLIMAFNITGMLPLAAEWKKRRREWKALLEEEE